MEVLLNGRPVELPRDNIQITVLDWLRSQGLTGSKEGCAEGECGACTVVLVRDSPAGTRYLPVNSCLLFLPMVAGQELYTIEGLAQKGILLDPQQKMADGGGSQCGYCTPGFVMSLFAEHYRPGRNGPCDPHAMAGNLCRCTGYRPIRDAALALGPAPDDVFRARLGKPAPAMAPLELEGFSRPASLRECIALLVDDPESLAIAGATDLAVEANLRDRRFRRLLSLEAIPELRRFEDTNEHVAIGAGLSLADIEARWTSAPAVVRGWFPLFASPLIRNRATLGGNLATASPIGDAAPLLLALDAEVLLAGPRGERVIPLAKFFTAYRKTVLEKGELMVAVAIPKPFPTLARFFKVAKRRMDDISTVAACFALYTDAAGVVTSARIAYGGVAATPVRVPPAERMLVGRSWNQESAALVQEIVGDSLQPMSDHRGSAAYRLAMAQTLLARFAFEHEEALAQA